MGVSKVLRQDQKEADAVDPQGIIDFEHGDPGGMLGKLIFIGRQVEIEVKGQREKKSRQTDEQGPDPGRFFIFE